MAPSAFHIWQHCPNDSFYIYSWHPVTAFVPFLFVCLFCFESVASWWKHSQVYKPSERLKTSFSVSVRLDSAGNQSVFMLPPIPRIICHLQSKGFLKVNLQPLPLSLSQSPWRSAAPIDAVLINSLYRWPTRLITQTQAQHSHSHIL